MPRNARLLLPKSYYHIMTRGNNRQIVFKCADDYEYYLHLIKRYKTDHPFDLYHYCLMPNHVHFLIRTARALDFADFMKKLNLAYLYHFKKNTEWVGHLWQDRYKSQPVGKDEYFIQCGKYIELNPVRAGIVSIPENYLYSSYRHYAKIMRKGLISDDPFYLELGQDELARCKEYQNMLIGDIIKDSYDKKVWGDGRQRDNESQKIKYHLAKKDKL